MSQVTTRLEEDSELVSLALAGNSDAGSALFRRHVDTVYGFVHARVGRDHSVAEDVTQNVFLDAWKNLRSFRIEGVFPSWLAGIARRKLARFYRDRDRHPAVDVSFLLESLCDGGPDPAEALDAGQAAAFVTGALTRVSSAHREVLVLKYSDGLSLKEIAGRTGSSPERVNSLLQRAREAFRKALVPADQD